LRAPHLAVVPDFDLSHGNADDSPIARRNPDEARRAIALGGITRVSVLDTPAMAPRCGPSPPGPAWRWWHMASRQGRPMMSRTHLFRAIMPRRPLGRAWTCAPGAQPWFQ
jgi:hypothetical protein